MEKAFQSMVLMFIMSLILYQCTYDEYNRGKKKVDADTRSKGLGQKVGLEFADDHGLFVSTDTSNEINPIMSYQYDGVYLYFASDKNGTYDIFRAKLNDDCSSFGAAENIDSVVDRTGSFSYSDWATGEPVTFNFAEYSTNVNSEEFDEKYFTISYAGRYDFDTYEPTEQVIVLIFNRENAENPFNSRIFTVPIKVDHGSPFDYYQCIPDDYEWAEGEWEEYVASSSLNTVSASNKTIIKPAKRINITNRPKISMKEVVRRNYRRIDLQKKAGRRYVKENLSPDGKLVSVLSNTKADTNNMEDVIWEPFLIKPEYDLRGRILGLCQEYMLLFLTETPPPIFWWVDDFNWGLNTEHTPGIFASTGFYIDMLGEPGLPSYVYDFYKIADNTEGPGGLRWTDVIISGNFVWGDIIGSYDYDYYEEWYEDFETHGSSSMITPLEGFLFSAKGLDSTDENFYLGPIQCEWNDEETTTEDDSWLWVTFLDERGYYIRLDRFSLKGRNETTPSIGWDGLLYCASDLDGTYDLYVFTENVVEVAHNFGIH